MTFHEMTHEDRVLVYSIRNGLMVKIFLDRFCHGISADKLNLSLYIGPIKRSVNCNEADWITSTQEVLLESIQISFFKIIQ